VCRQQWPAFGKVWSTRRTLCAGTPGQPAGICSGDQGGPLFVKGRNVKQDRLVGIAAFNGPKGCGRGGLSERRRGRLGRVPARGVFAGPCQLLVPLGRQPAAAHPGSL
jgi:hypothetical protein